jgi:F-type H+-transporting ATPase subunit b
MLDINGWFFVQLANFFILFIVLNTLLFKPVLRQFKEREEKTSGALEKAREMDKQKDAVITRIDERLLDARNKAREVFEESSNEGMSVQKEALGSAQNEAVEINRKAKEDLKAAAEKARAGLKSDIEAFSKNIVEKLVGA